MIAQNGPKWVTVTESKQWYNISHATAVSLIFSILTCTPTIMSAYSSCGRASLEFHCSPNVP